MTKPKLIIMVGNIISGKSTWIKKYLAMDEIAIEKNNWVVLSKDDIRRMLGAGSYLWDKETIEPIVHESLISILHHSMQRNVNIIMDETNMDKATRNQYLFLTKHCSSLGYDYETIAVVMPFIPCEKMIKRIGYREGRPEWGPFPREVWEAVWQRKNDKFKMPILEEGFDEILEIK